MPPTAWPASRSPLPGLAAVAHHAGIVADRASIVSRDRALSDGTRLRAEGLGGSDRSLRNDWELPNQRDRAAARLRRLRARGAWGALRGPCRINATERRPG